MKHAKLRFEEHLYLIIRDDLNTDTSIRMTRTTEKQGGPRFVDPSADPTYFWYLIRFIFALGLRVVVNRALRSIWRFITVEHAIGFDGVDDFIRIKYIDLDGFRLNTRILLQNEMNRSVVVSIEDSVGNKIFRLVRDPDDDSRLQAIYRNAGKIESSSLAGTFYDGWHDLNITSDGRGVSIQVDGTTVVPARDIDSPSSPCTVCFGGSPAALSYFNGMMKYLKVWSKGSVVFSLESGETLEVKEDAKSADMVGIHHMKKGRLDNEFSA